MGEQKYHFPRFGLCAQRRRHKDSQSHAADFDDQGIIFNLGDFSAKGRYHNYFFIALSISFTAQSRNTLLSARGSNGLSAFTGHRSISSGKFSQRFKAMANQ